MNAQLIPAEIQKHPSALAAPSEAQKIVTVCESYVIDSPEMFQLAADELRSVATRRKAIEEARFTITRPMDAAKSAVMDFFRGPLELFEKAERTLRSRMIAWENAERERADRERREAAARAAAEKAEAEQRQRDAEEAARQAQANGDAVGAAALQESAEEAREDAELAAVAPLAVVAPTKVAGYSSRSNWKGEVTDLTALIIAAASNPVLRGLLQIDQTALNQMAKSTKGAVEIPGVRVYDDRVASVRR